MVVGFGSSSGSGLNIRAVLLNPTAEDWGICRCPSGSKKNPEVPFTSQTLHPCSYKIPNPKPWP